MRAFKLVPMTLSATAFALVMSGTAAIASTAVPDRCQSEVYETQYLRSYARGYDYVHDYFVSHGSNRSERCAEYAEFSPILRALIEMWSIPEEATDLVYCVYEGRRNGMTAALDELDLRCSECSE